MSLLPRIAGRLVIALPIAAAVLFLPAGSLKFWQGWLVLSIFLVCSLLIAFYLCRHDSALLQRRLQNKENTSEQKLFRKLWIPLWTLALTLPGLDYRLGLSRTLLRAVPPWLTLLSAAFLLYGYFLIFRVMKVNSFASSTIQVEAGQRVISDGPYRFVRHPMYSAFLVLILFIPLALGSYVAVPVFALLIPVLVFRLVHEEITLRQELPGYAEYCDRTRFRLVPFVF
jgi:protein-S-isoprenylcysteine O-methyltransferase Ste14